MGRSCPREYGSKGGGQGEKCQARARARDMKNREGALWERESRSVDGGGETVVEQTPGPMYRDTDRKTRIAYGVR